uniref:Uncharacterized protein n=1 Tax=Trichuris muris TaxID=70415 RepID=A0A5S6QC67_TRIMR
MSINDLEACQRFAEVVRFLQDRGLFHAERTCVCGNAMKFCERNSRHGPRWRCNKAIFRKEVPARRGTWFAAHKMELNKVLVFVYSWSRGYTDNGILSPPIVGPFCNWYGKDGDALRFTSHNVIDKCTKESTNCNTQRTRKGDTQNTVY